VFVDVYPLRHNGEKLPTDKLVGVRGHLHLEACTVSGEAGRPARRSYSAHLTDGRPAPYPGASMRCLYGVTLTRMDSRGFVLTGTELASYQERYREDPQAWFCVPVSAGAPVGRTALATSE
jgi:hypothetical protein